MERRALELKGWGAGELGGWGAAAVLRVWGMMMIFILRVTTAKA
jgi:hypothetical protein